MQRIGINHGSVVVSGRKADNAQYATKYQAASATCGGHEIRQIAHLLSDLPGKNEPTQIDCDFLSSMVIPAYCRAVRGS